MHALFGGVVVLVRLAVTLLHVLSFQKYNTYARFRRQFTHDHSRVLFDHLFCFARALTNMFPTDGSHNMFNAVHFMILTCVCVCVWVCVGGCVCVVELFFFVLSLFSYVFVSSFVAQHV